MIKDLNDLLIAVEHDTTAFNEQLAMLPVRVIDNAPDEAAMDDLFRPNTPVQPDNHREFPSSFYEAIERALGVTGYKSNGFSNDICCPFHEDENPSAGWHGEKHFLKCFACGQQFLAKEVGEKLGIDWRDYVQAPAVSERSTGSHTSEAEQPHEEVTVKLNSKVKPPKPTDDELGDQLIMAWDGNLAYFYEQWYQYQPEGYWTPTDQVPAQIWNTMKLNKDKRINPTYSKAKSIEAYMREILRVPLEQVDQGEGYLNLRNGLLNLETRELEPHRRELFLTSQLDFEYDPEASCPVFNKFLGQSLVTKDGQADPQLRNLILELIGYSLTTDTSKEKGVWLYGEGGSGKSTLLRVLQGLLGNACGTVDFSTLDGNPYQLALIPGKRILICSEAKINNNLAEQHIKMIISGEELLVRQIYGVPFYCWPQGKLWWAMNELPYNQDRSNAIYRRLIIVPFHKPVPRDKQDPNLINKLLAERPGILNLALEGLKRLREQGDFTHVEQVKSMVEDYKESNDVEAGFIEDAEWSELDEALCTQASVLYMAYKAWCERFGHKPKTATKVARDWERLGFVKYTKKGVRWYRGISLTKLAQDVVKHAQMQQGDKSQ